MLIRPIKNRVELDKVYRLTHDAYVEQGYCAPQPDGRLIHYPHLDCLLETTVLVAVEDGEIVGTHSLTLDGPRGLPVDADFKKECDRIRAEGRPLASSWRIVVRSDYRRTRVAVLGLIGETIRSAVKQGIKTCVFTFNPRHESAYRRLLNMRTVGRKETTDGLKNAPAVFMRCDFEALPAKWLRSLEVSGSPSSVYTAAPKPVLAAGRSVDVA